MHISNNSWHWEVNTTEEEAEPVGRQDTKSGSVIFQTASAEEIITERMTVDKR